MTPGEVPPIRERAPAGDALDLFLRLARPGETCLLLDSNPAAAATAAERETRRWSVALAAPASAIVARGPRAWRRDGAGAWRELADGPADPFALGRALLAEGPRVAPDGVPFAGGVAGFLGYDAGRHVEKLPSLARDDHGEPDALLARFAAALVADHARGEAWLVAADDAEGRAALATLRARLRERAPAPRETALAAPAPTLAASEFERMVERARRHVRAGDVFQVNLSHRLDAPARGADPLALYARLRRANPAPFAALLLSGELPAGAGNGFLNLLSSSPERLFALDAGGRLEARPIAGTRPRGGTRAEDDALASELAADAKERAEHVMLVDLARNDLGRVAAFGSVRVPRLLAVESYRRVHHLVSTVEARLARGKDAWDALKATFPGGTITGAPKVRAMELIEEIEPARRGAYTGSLGYASATGDSDWSILIRTLVQDADRVSLQVGAGIVWDSVPEREWRETLAKAEGVLNAFPERGRDVVARVA